MSGRTFARLRPERTCVGCRERAAKTDLLRIVVVGDNCVPDDRGTLPGRGAYVHPALVCLDLAVRRRAFLRAFKVKGPLDAAGVRRHMQDAQEAAQTAP
ncbi:YlxR family protein [Streptomyces albipurpureus]|uniref:YlxR family protein n=1 Tax=Streptomyces albipurpureus TaxID=2897419 RepID=A0ABT0UWS1_9ACTN|nr:YlxR family protein [Streptomyces sp. CWNU-1]MCM2392896.1 YlxR family protein [Streptomyces sp. CWNU-1]